MSSVELGSDIGGSIRTPAHFCGVYGHKPSHGIVPMRGHIPGPPGTVAHPDLAVAGPLARSADDLALMMDVLTKQESAKAGWHLHLPKPTRNKWRVAVYFEDKTTFVEPEVAAVFAQLKKQLADSADIEIIECHPPNLSVQEVLSVYQPLLGSILGSGVPPKVRRQFPIVRQVLRLQAKLGRAPQQAADYL